MSELFATGDVASAYNQWSQTYESVQNLTRDLAAKVLRSYPLNLSNCDVLEIGCGTGVNTGYLADQSRQVLAVDFSSGMLAQCRRIISNPNVIFKQQDIRNRWEIDDRTIDAAIIMLVVEHIENLSHIYQEAARVLRAGGELFICEYHPYRQMQGKQARYVDVDSGEEKLIPAYLHQISEYVNLGMEQGFELLNLGEWSDEGDSAIDQLPRLVTVHLRR